MEQNKTGKYFKYAIGEVVLVVIGILIALSINNWNLNRIARDKETLLLKELNQEFKRNKEQFMAVELIHRSAMNGADFFLNLFPISLNEINLDSISSYYSDLSYRYTFNPSQGVIKSLINTSSFEIISNNELRKLIISWDDVLKDYQEEEITASNYVINTMTPFFREHFNWDGDFGDNRNNLQAFTTLKFESIIKQRQSDLNDVLNLGELKTIHDTIDRIIELTNSESND